MVCGCLLMWKVGSLWQCRGVAPLVMLPHVMEGRVLCFVPTGQAAGMEHQSVRLCHCPDSASHRAPSVRIHGVCKHPILFIHRHPLIRPSPLPKNLLTHSIQRFHLCHPTHTVLCRQVTKPQKIYLWQAAIHRLKNRWEFATVLLCHAR